MEYSDYLRGVSGHFGISAGAHMSLAATPWFPDLFALGREWVMLPGGPFLLWLLGRR